MPGASVTGKVERHEKFGVFVFLAPGRTGLMPMSETGLDREADVARAFPIGSDVEVVVLEADPAGRRIRLSRKAVAQQREQAECASTPHERTPRRRRRWDRLPTSCGARSRDNPRLDESDGPRMLACAGSSDPAPYNRWTA